MSGNTPEEPPDGPVPSPTPTGGNPSDPAGQVPYTYPPPPPPDQIWPPPPGSVYQVPMPFFPTPTNAVLILVLGIASIPIAMLCGIGGLIGIIPWVMGNASVKAISQGRANPAELGSVNGGRICGIVGTILAALLLVFGVILFAYGLYSDRHGR